MPRRKARRFAGQEGQLPKRGLLPVVLLCQLGQEDELDGHDGVAAGQCAVIGFLGPDYQALISVPRQVEAAGVRVGERGRLPAELLRPAKIVFLQRGIKQHELGGGGEGVFIQETAGRPFPLPEADIQAVFIGQMGIQEPLRRFRGVEIAGRAGDPIEKGQCRYHQRVPGG